MRVVRWLSVAAVLGLGIGMWRGLAAHSDAPGVLFIANEGQFPDAVQFRTWGGDQIAWLTADGLWLSQSQADGRVAQLHLTFPDAGPLAWQPTAPLPTQIAYYGYTAAPLTDVAAWGAARLSEVYPGVDLTLTSQAGRLLAQWTGPGVADMPPVQIAGVETGRLPFMQPTLVEWQAADGRRQFTYQPTARVARDRTPGVDYATFLGDILQEEGNAIAYDSSGAAHAGGTTFSVQFPGGPLSTVEHGVDVYAVKFNPTGSALEYVVWINPATLNAEDYGYGLGLDAAGNAYLTGNVRSPDFCSGFGGAPGYDTTFNGDADAFMVRITPVGQVDYCSFLGGLDLDTARAIAVAPDGSFTVVGGTWSSEFPRTQGTLTGQRDVFITHFASGGLTLTYGWLLGGDLQEEATSAVRRANGELFVTGWARSANFPTTPGSFSPLLNGDFDAFVVKLNSAGNMVYATYLGGVGEDRGYGVDVDELGRVVVTGSTASASGFPLSADAFDATFNNVGLGADSYIVKLSADGASLVYGTYLGGSGDERGSSVVSYGNGQVYVTGYTWSPDFPTTADGDGVLDGGQDAFLLALTPGQVTLDYGTFIGGSDWDLGSDVLLDGAGRAFLIGATRSADFPVTAGAFDTTHNGDYDAFIMRLNGFPIVITPTPSPSPTLPPTSTPTPLPSPTLPPTATATPTATYTPLPTSTATSLPPTATPSPTPMPTATSTPSPTPTGTPAAEQPAIFLPLAIKP